MIWVRLTASNEGSLRRHIELPDPGNAIDDPQGCVDLVFGVASYLVEEGGSER